MELVLAALVAISLVYGHESPQYLQGDQQQQQHGHNTEVPIQHQTGGTGRNRLMESAHDTDHVFEHLDHIMNKPKDQMSPEELQFYYFKVHDYDGNNKLDGSELIKAVTHFHASSDSSDPNVAEQGRVFTDTEIADIVEAILKQDDFNNDGYIEYAEFVLAQKRPPPEAEAAAQAPPPSPPQQ